MSDSTQTPGDAGRRSSLPLFTVSGLTKIYNVDSPDGGVKALNSIDLDIYQGEFVSIVGQSGCGKTTLLRIMAGLLNPTEGKIEFDGEPVVGPLSDIGFVFQSPVLLKWKDVFDNVMFPYHALNSSGQIERPRDFYEDRAHELLELVGLEGFKEAYPNELSGGMQQRVAICRALLPDPSILLMDEPFGALDEFTRDKLNRELLTIWEETGKTIAFVTHNIEEAVYLADRLVVLSARPGEVLTVRDIDIERPRPLSVRDTEAFVEETAEVRRNLGVYEDE